jgi:hypothetical protein
VRSLIRAAVVVVFALVLAACTLTDGPVAIRTLPAGTTACELAGISGTLVEDSTYGLALGTSGQRLGVVWPSGYTARRESGVVLLVGPGGAVVAREGDHIRAAGGYAEGEVIVECDIHVAPSPGADAT